MKVALSAMAAHLASMATLCVVLGPHAQERFYAGAPQYCTAELNGDSILHGFGYTPSGRLAPSPADWLRAYGYAIDDRSVNGLSTHDLASPDYRNFFGTPHDSRIVVIQTGVNDYRDEYLSDWPARPAVQGVKDDYGNMVNHIRNLGKIPVIAGVAQIEGPGEINALGPAGYEKVGEIRAAVRAVAVEKSVYYAGFDTIQVAWTDTVHLEQGSSNGLAESLRYVLAYICYLPF